MGQVSPLLGHWTDVGRFSQCPWPGTGQWPGSLCQLLHTRVPGDCPGRWHQGAAKEPSDEEVSETEALWGPIPVRPAGAVYRKMVASPENDLQNVEARYMNTVKPAAAAQQPKYNPSLERVGWVSGCSAALTRRDLFKNPGSRGQGPNATTGFPVHPCQRCHPGPAPQRLIIEQGGGGPADGGTPTMKVAATTAATLGGRAGPGASNTWLFLSPVPQVPAFHCFSW